MACRAWKVPVRDAVSRMLPAWASATTDSAGNLIVSVGEGEPLVVFVAHLDEIGFVITAIRDDGTLELKQRGGFFLSLFEAQPALVHTGDRSIPGVFLPRDSARRIPAPHTGTVPRRRRRGLTRRRGGDGDPRRSHAHHAQAVRAARRHARHRPLVRRPGRAAPPRSWRCVDSTRSGCIIASSSCGACGRRRGSRARVSLRMHSASRRRACTRWTPSCRRTRRSRSRPSPMCRSAPARWPARWTTAASRRRHWWTHWCTWRCAGRCHCRWARRTVATMDRSSRRGACPTCRSSWPLRYAHSPAEVIDLKDVQALAQLIQAVAEDW